MSAQNPRVVALRNFIMGWHVSYLASEDARGQPEVGPQERLSKTGDNLANVIQYLSEEHPSRLEGIFGNLRIFCIPACFTVWPKNAGRPPTPRRFW